MKKILLFYLLLFSSVCFAMPNPAAVNCNKHHFDSIELNTAEGSVAFCIFPDRSYCEEWSYFRNECHVGQFYWPEEVIDTQHFEKYCVDDSDKKSGPKVVLCRPPKAIK